jgi:anti-anti-sigma regulatory factor
MNITVEQDKGKVPVTVMQLGGELDASSYLDVINKARELYMAGTRDLLLDLGRMNFMASSGLVALHSIALLMRGKEPPDPENGWSAFRAIALDVESDAGYEPHCKLLNPQPRIKRTLEITGLLKILEVFSDREQAIASF